MTDNTFSGKAGDMDPISAIGDERRRMVENTQRSSSSLHAQTVKRHKDRIKRGNVNSSYHTSEAEEDFNSDFMAGDEDELDYSGGGGNADLFRQMWEDDVEANIPEPMAGDTIFEEVESSGLLGGTGATEEAVSSSLSAVCSERASPDGACTEVVELGQGSVQSGNDCPDGACTEVEELPPDPVQSGKDGPDGACTEVVVLRPDQVQSGDAEPSESEAASAEGETSLGEEQAVEPSPEQISMGAAMAELFGGLDSLLSGADNAVKLEGRADIMQLVSAPTPSDSLPRTALPPVSADIGQVLDKLIFGCTHSELLERLRSLLGRFGKGVLSCCVARGIKVHVVPSGQLSGVDCLRGVADVADMCGGVYIANNRTCYLEEQAISSVPQGSNPVIFFMAQAWDHALGEDDFASLHAPAVIANFEACRVALEGHRFGDSLSATSPVLYFAQAVEAYLAENDCAAELWNREDLYDFDRSMYDYVEYLFKQGNKQ